MSHPLRRAAAALAALLPAAAAAEDDVLADAAADLAAVAVGTDDGPLDVYGFADFKVTKYLLDQDSSWRPFLSPYSSFAVGNFNLYLEKRLERRWRMLGEVRFHYLPHGTDNFTADGTFARVDTSIPDYVDYNSGINYNPGGTRWGGIEIERLHLDYQAHRLLTVRAGQWLTPYGLWNVDHGALVQIAVRRPYIISEELFPERQTGLAVSGTADLRASRLDYHVTLSNGRGPVDAYRDMDESKALGGRLRLTTGTASELAVGASAYYGRYSDRVRTWQVSSDVPEPTLEVQDRLAEQFDELALGADLRWRAGPLHLDLEVVSNQRAYTDAGRPVAPGSTGVPRYTSDYHRWGAYGLVGYRTPWWGVMPFVLVEVFRFEPNVVLRDVHVVTGGLNIRPTPAVVLKLQGFRARFPDANPDGLAADPVAGLEAQLAWAF